MKTMKKHISSSLLPSISNQFDFFGANFSNSGGLPQSQIYSIYIYYFHSFAYTQVVEALAVYSRTCTQYAVAMWQFAFPANT